MPRRPPPPSPDHEWVVAGVTSRGKPYEGHWRPPAPSPDHHWVPPHRRGALGRVSPGYWRLPNGARAPSSPPTPTAPPKDLQVAPPEVEALQVAVRVAMEAAAAAEAIEQTDPKVNRWWKHEEAPVTPPPSRPPSTPDEAPVPPEREVTPPEPTGSLVEPTMEIPPEYAAGLPDVDDVELEPDDLADGPTRPIDGLEEWDGFARERSGPLPAFPEVVLDVTSAEALAPPSAPPAPPLYVPPPGFRARPPPTPGARGHVTSAATRSRPPEQVETEQCRRAQARRSLSVVREAVFGTPAELAIAAELEAAGFAEHQIRAVLEARRRVTG